MAKRAPGVFPAPFLRAVDGGHIVVCATVKRFDDLRYVV
jgi:hypothetical protein